MDYFNEYILLINELKKIFPNDDILNNIDLNDLSLITNNCILFNNLINVSENFDLFLNCKIKVFSHKNDETLKISCSLFGSDLFIKDLLNNQNEDIKKKIWILLHKLYVAIEKSKSIDEINNENIEKINKLSNLKINFNKEELKDQLYTILDIDNDDTNNMIDDIIGSFDSIMNNSDNPFNNIMDISKEISSKYSNKISTGEIKLDKLMSAIMSKIPNLSPDGMPCDLSNVINQFSDISNTILPNIMNEEKKETVVIDDNFSTADIELGKLEESKNSLKLGNILKIADQFGVIPGGKNKSEGPNISEMFSNFSDTANSGAMPDMSKMFEMFDNKDNKIPELDKMLSLLKKVSSSDANENINDISNEMNDILKNNLFKNRN